MQMWCCCFSKRRKSPPPLPLSFSPLLPPSFQEKENDNCQEEEYSSDCDFGTLCSPCANVCIENDPTLTDDDLAIQDCSEIAIHNCPKITRVPSVAAFQWLEVVKLTHCTITECRSAFPPTLRNLTISYCQLAVFEPRCLNVADMAAIDLSHNSLTGIPPLLSEFSGEFSVKNNDLWYAAYSAMPLHRVTPDTTQELAVAYKFSLIPTHQMMDAIRHLKSKRHHSQAGILQSLVDATFGERTRIVKNTFANTQNAHLVSIQTSTKHSIQHLMREVEPYTRDDELLLEDAIRDLKFKSDPKKIRAFKKHTRHPQYDATTMDVFSRVFTVARSHPHAAAIFEILAEEIDEGLCTCYTGLLSRIVGALNGFDDKIKITISSREELLNTVVALRRRYGLQYGNTDEYTTEIVPVVWQLLEDHCVPEGEHNEWLAYL